MTPEAAGGVAIQGDTLYFAVTRDDDVAVIDAATLNPKNDNPELALFAAAGTTARSEKKSFKSSERAVA